MSIFPKYCKNYSTVEKCEMFLTIEIFTRSVIFYHLWFVSIFPKYCNNYSTVEKCDMFLTIVIPTRDVIFCHQYIVTKFPKWCKKSFLWWILHQLRTSIKGTKRIWIWLRPMPNCCPRCADSAHNCRFFVAPLVPEIRKKIQMG